MKISSEAVEILYIVSAVAAGLSLIGNTLIIFLYLSIKNLRLYVFRLVFYLSICDFLKCLILMVPINATSGNGLICQTLGYFLAYLSISGVVWVLAIAISLNQILIEKHHNIERYHKTWFFLAMILPAIVAIFPFLTKSYGPSVAWCTLKEDKISRIWKFFMFYLPSWLLILLIILIYTKVCKNLKLNPAVSEDELGKRAIIKRIIAYPLILVLTFLPITCVRVVYVTTGQSDLASLSIAYFCYGIRGLLNSVVYGYNDIVIKNFKESFLSKHINESIRISEM